MMFPEFRKPARGARNPACEVRMFFLAPSERKWDSTLINTAGINFDNTFFVAEES
jgi:hypothetical protein